VLFFFYVSCIFQEKQNNDLVPVYCLLSTPNGRYVTVMRFRDLLLMLRQSRDVVALLAREQVLDLALELRLSF